MAEAPAPPVHPLPKILLAAAVALPAIGLRLTGTHLPPLAAIFLYGSAVVAAAFLLAWGAEAAHKDISGSLATALLALIAVLPEYAIDLYFGYSAGHSPEAARYAAANMTGSNRLLLGFGWPFVLLLLVLGARSRNKAAAKRGGKPEPLPGEVVLEKSRRLELAGLGIASFWCLFIPFRGHIGLVDAAVLLALFALYLWRASGEEKGEPDLVGVAAALGDLPQAKRRLSIIALFVFAAVVVLCAAQPFADSLVHGGRSLGLDEFLLVQWLAPIASEAPEFLVAAILAFRGNGDGALGTLLSSKLNQWTLLIGSLPLAHLAGGGDGALPLDARQYEELLLTATQALLGFAVLADLRLRTWEAILLVALFASQLFFPQTNVRLAFSAAYAVAGALILAMKTKELIEIGKTAAGRANTT